MTVFWAQRPLAKRQRGQARLPDHEVFGVVHHFRLKGFQREIIKQLA